jgi:hypothetical protein
MTKKPVAIQIRVNGGFGIVGIVAKRVVIAMQAAEG